ncbi:hypothetical protein SUDANB171_00897 [Streptomyces sp. enrichment culture]|uniref:AAA family ATPase n=1 Tax=Streptomyces xiamenensis TaxID=408015 RepID=UPI0037D73EBB
MRRKTREQVERLVQEMATELAELRSPGIRDAVHREAQRIGEAAAHEAIETYRSRMDNRLHSIRDTAVKQATEAVLDRTRQTLEDANRTYLEQAKEQAREIFHDSVPPVISVQIDRAPPVRVTENSHEVLPDVILVLKARCHALLVGPAGTGKSTIAQQVARTLDLEFHALSLGPTTPMSKIFGYYDAHGTYHDTPFRRAFEEGGLMLLDELDSGHPGLLSELNQALSLGVCAFADDMVTAHPDFRVIATANTYGTGPDRQYTGRQALDAATLDRFVILDVPVDEALEERLALAQAPTREAEALEVLHLVRKLRATAREKRLPVMFSPRASIDSAKLIQAGACVEEAVEWRVLRGISDAHRAALGADAS